MAERDLGRTELASKPVQRPASQPRAERAHRLALGDHALHHRVGVLLDDAIGYAAAFEILRKHLRWKPRLLLVHVHRHEDRKSTRLNSSHGYISYAVFCLKKKKTKMHHKTIN